MIVSMKKFINKTDEVENEMVAGLVKAFPGHVRTLDGGNVIVRAEKKTDKVALVTGGGSGHEPSFGGWAAALAVRDPDNELVFE